MTGQVDRALQVLRGMSVGDALGERFFGLHERVVVDVTDRRVPEPEWTWTDDTLMACSVTEQLLERGTIDPQALFASFVARFDRRRGYGGAAAHR